jgi:hypothetical protein
MRRIALTSLVFSLLLSGVYLYSQTNDAVERSLESKERAVAGMEESQPKVI